ncbi:MAG: transglycosylase SLT domain-containing protein [Oscillospiraceae bacterium]|nr:transglycosylase SLT domain-containing protein [Oscillospiraceae bacterium]
MKLLESVPLDAETQAAILELCGGDRDTFCAIMAIAWVESRFDTDAVGDNGVSIGMMQINTRWHTGRMEALGVTDLTDPVQCAAVALDYLRELSEGYGFRWITDHDLYMAYNMGPGNARTALNAGTTSSHYSRSVLAAFGEYAAEMEAAA